MQPLDYGTVFLFDELELRAHYQLMENNLSNNPINALSDSQTVEDLLNHARINRRALFSAESIAASFGVTKQIYNTGWFGRLLAFFLKTLGFNPHK